MSLSGRVLVVVDLTNDVSLPLTLVPLVVRNPPSIEVLGGTKIPKLVVETSYWAFSVAVQTVPPNVEVLPEPSTTGVVARTIV